MKEKQRSSKAALRNRWRSFFKNGSMAALRSEGRLVALYVFHVADWSTCEARFSIRRAASLIGVSPNSVHRGIKQLVGIGILEILENGTASSMARYRVADCPQVVDSLSTSGGQDCPQVVDRLSTSGGQSAYERWTERTRGVDSLSTHCGRNSVLSSGYPVITSGDTSPDEPPDGLPPSGVVRKESGDSESEATR